MRLNKAEAVTQPRRVIVLGWYDGPTEGLCSLASSGDYWFRMLDEDIDPDGPNDRLFALRRLPPNSTERFIEAAGVGDRFGPDSCWSPPSQPAWGELEPLLDELKRSAAACEVIVRGEQFTMLTAAWRVTDFQDVSDWFRYLGIRRHRD